MPNRTIYLPDDLDVLSRRLGLNLSRLAQDAIAREAAAHPAETLEARVSEALERTGRLGIDWPPRLLADTRAEANER